MKAWLELALSGALGAARIRKDREGIIRAGEPAHSAYLLAHGAAEIYQDVEGGSSVVVKLVTAPTILCSPELVAEERLYLASIRSAGSSTLFQIERADYMELVRTHPAASLESLRDISSAFCGAAKLESARLFETEALLANLLLAYSEVFGVAGPDGLCIQLRRSQQDLAAAVGGAERSVNRIVTRWKRDGLIAKRAGRYIVKDSAALLGLAGNLAGSLVHRWRPPSPQYLTPDGLRSSR